MDGGAWKAAVHGVTEGRTRLSDFTFTFHFHALEKEMATHSNVNPLQCSCLENPREGGAWWAAVYGVAQSRTRLKQLSSSSRTKPAISSDCACILSIISRLLIIPAAAAAKSLQSCPTLCDPRDDSPPGSPVPGILQARTLEWVAISFSKA